MKSKWMPAMKADRKGNLLPCVVRVLNYEAQPEAFQFEYFSGFGVKIDNLDDARKAAEMLNNHERGNK